MRTLECQSCSRQADLVLDDGSLWCIACDTSARELGYDNRRAALLDSPEVEYRVICRLFPVEHVNLEHALRHLNRIDPTHEGRCPSEHPLEARFVSEWRRMG